MSPSIEAARQYLNNHLGVTSGEKWSLFNKKERIWVSESNELWHICYPRKVLHFIQSKDFLKISFGKKSILSGKVINGASWHTTDELVYMCCSCKKKFKGTTAFLMKMAVDKKDELIS